MYTKYGTRGKFIMFNSFIILGGPCINLVRKYPVVSNSIRKMIPTMAKAYLDIYFFIKSPTWYNIIFYKKNKEIS